MIVKLDKPKLLADAVSIISELVLEVKKVIIMQQCRIKTTQLSICPLIGKEIKLAI